MYTPFFNRNKCMRKTIAEIVAKRDGVIKQQRNVDALIFYVSTEVERGTFLHYAHRTSGSPAVTLITRRCINLW